MYKYTGIDISKQSLDCSIATGEGVLFKKLSNNEKGFKTLLNCLPAHAHVVMEASGPYYYKLAFFLHEHNVRLSVVNPLVVRRFCQMRMVRTKTDKKDAVMIREYGLTEQPGTWQPDAPAITQLKQLNGAIELMDKNITAYGNQLEAFKEMPDADKSLLKWLKQNIARETKLKEKLEQQMEKVALENYRDGYKALQTIPGIGPKAAAIMIAVSGNFKKFSCYKQMVAYVGLNPRIFESGTSVKGKTHISKMGTARLRKILYLCSWSAKRCNQQCREMYERLKLKAKPEKVIKIAIANKLLRQAFAVGKSLSSYQINYQPTIAY